MPARSTPSVKRMVALIQDSGGELRIANPPSVERAGWRRTIYAADKDGGLPAGFRLRYSGRDSGDLLIRLVPDTQGNEPRRAPQVPVPVPARLPTRAHPVVTATRDVVRPDRDGWIDTRRTLAVAHLSVAKASLPRALRLLQGLLAEAERRGYAVVTATGHGQCAGGAGIQIGGQVLEVVISEERTRVAHEPTAAERARSSTYTWGPRWDYLPSGRLRLRVGHDSWSPALATDRQRWRIEDRLGQAFERLEATAAQARARQLEREAEAAEREAARRLEIQAAGLREAEARRVDDLLGEVQAWRSAGDIRAFVTGARAKGLTSGHRDPEWLDWAIQYAAAIDPIRNSTMGDDPLGGEASS